MCTAIAMVFAYVEVLLPPLFTAVPGIKLGLPNIAIIFVLYRFGPGQAAAVSFVRIVAVSLLFGNPMTFAYSLAGGILSLSAMALLKRLDILSTVGVSVAGGVLHNVGQIAMASIMLSTNVIVYYLPFLLVSGIVAGIAVGVAAGILIKRIRI